MRAALFPMASSKPAPKMRERHAWPPEAIAFFEEFYKTEPIPTLESRKRLAGEWGVTPRQIQVWFQNRRQREKNAALQAERESKEAVAQPPAAPRQPGAAGPTFVEEVDVLGMLEALDSVEATPAEAVAASFDGVPGSPAESNATTSSLPAVHWSQSLGHWSALLGEQEAGKRQGEGEG